MTDRITTTVSVSHKIALSTKFEMAEVFVSLSGVEPDTTEEEIDAALDQSKIVFRKIVERVKEKTAMIREEELG